MGPLAAPVLPAAHTVAQTQGRPSLLQLDVKLSPGRAVSTPWAAGCRQTLPRALWTGSQVSRADAPWRQPSEWERPGDTGDGGAVPRSPCCGVCAGAAHAGHSLPLDHVGRREKPAFWAGGRDEGTRALALGNVGPGARASARGKGRARPRSGAGEEEKARAGWLLQERVRWGPQTQRGLPAGPRLLAGRPGHRGGPCRSVMPPRPRPAVPSSAASPGASAGGFPMARSETLAVGMRCSLGLSYCV